MRKSDVFLRHSLRNYVRAFDSGFVSNENVMHRLFFAQNRGKIVDYHFCCIVNVYIYFLSRNVINRLIEADWHRTTKLRLWLDIGHHLSATSGTSQWHGAVQYLDKTSMVDWLILINNYTIRLDFRINWSEKVTGLEILMYPYLWKTFENL